jgi:hypothetical protein
VAETTASPFSVVFLFFIGLSAASDSELLSELESESESLEEDVSLDFFLKVTAFFMVVVVFVSSSVSASEPESESESELELEPDDVLSVELLSAKTLGVCFVAAGVGVGASGVFFFATLTFSDFLLFTSDFVGGVLESESELDEDEELSEVLSESSEDA